MMLYNPDTVSKNKLLKKYILVLFGFLNFMITGGGKVFSQSVPREEIIASYICNFAQNTEWPGEDKIVGFNFKVITGNVNYFEEIKKLSATKKIRNKPFGVTVEEKLTSVENTQLIFVGKDKESSIAGIFDSIEGKNILLVSENCENKKEVMINFYETKDRKIRFEINKANILNQGLKILPEMILLGGTEIDVAQLYRESQVSLRTLQKQVEALQDEEARLKSAIQISENQISFQKQAIIKQTADIDSQNMQLGRQKEELKKLFNDIHLKQDVLDNQSYIISERERELAIQKTEIYRRERVLLSQKTKIDSLNGEIKSKARTLDKQQATITNQRNFLILLISALIFGIGLSYLLYREYRNKKKVNTLLSKEIKERIKIEEALGKSEDLYNNAPCGYHSIDQNGVLVRINDTELNWLGYTRDELIGKLKFSDLITDESKMVYQDNFPKFVQSGKIHDIEFDMVRKDGTILPILLSATAIIDSGGIFLMSRSSIFDITFRKQAAQEIQKLNQELEKRVKERTSQLEVANRELEAFAYSVSHDLRAPLRGIEGFSQLLLDSYYNQLDDTGKKHLDRIRLSTERMGQLIDDMLKLSRISRSEMIFVEVDLSKKAHEIARNLANTQPERKVNFIIHDGIRVFGDSRLLYVALENLIGNAWKFTSRHEFANIEFGKEYRENKPVYFIRDDGAGFEMQFAKKLFGAFQRLHTTTEFPGTGIGLATVQRIINRHGGAIWAEAEVEKGATFYFSISA